MESRPVLHLSPLPCGQTGFRYKVIGRTDDMLKVKGVMIYPPAEEMHRRIKIRPKITWIPPRTLERFVKKKKIIENAYETK